MTISSVLLIRERLPGYCCKYGIAIFACFMWRVNWIYAYSRYEILIPKSMISSVPMCFKCSNVFQVFQCVSSVPMFFKCSNVFQVFQCVSSNPLCFKCFNVFQVFQCVSSNPLCFKCSNVFQVFQCVSSVPMCFKGSNEVSKRHLNYICSSLRAYSSRKRRVNDF